MYRHACGWAAMVLDALAQPLPRPAASLTVASVVPPLAIWPLCEHAGVEALHGTLQGQRRARPESRTKSSRCVTQNLWGHSHIVELPPSFSPLLSPSSLLGPLGRKLICRWFALVAISSPITEYLYVVRPRWHRWPWFASRMLKKTRGAQFCMGWSFGDFGAAVKSGAGRAKAQWQELSKRRRVSRLLIGRAKCRCAPQTGQSAARSRLPAGI